MTAKEVQGAPASGKQQGWVCTGHQLGAETVLLLWFLLLLCLKELSEERAHFGLQFQGTVPHIWGC